MRVLLVHPSALMYSEIFLRLEPLGLERVAAALLADGHDVRLIDLQVYRHADLERQVAAFQPEAVGFSLNYLANVPEVVDLAKWIKTVLPDCLVFAGGHSVSFVAEQVLAHAEGAIDVVLKGEGETGAPALLAALPDRALADVPGAVTRGRARAARRDAAQPGRAPARPAPGRAAPQVLHRGDGPGRVHRVHPRLPVGLLVLQRLDVLRPQLPQAVAGGSGRGHGPHRRARRVHRR